MNTRPRAVASHQPRCPTPASQATSRRDHAVVSEQGGTCSERGIIPSGEDTSEGHLPLAGAPAKWIRMQHAVSPLTSSASSCWREAAGYLLPTLIAIVRGGRRTGPLSCSSPVPRWTLAG